MLARSQTNSDARRHIGNSGRAQEEEKFMCIGIVGMTGMTMPALLMVLAFVLMSILIVFGMTFIGVIVAFLRGLVMVVFDNARLISEVVAGSKKQRS